MQITMCMQPCMMFGNLVVVCVKMYVYMCIYAPLHALPHLLMLYVCTQESPIASCPHTLHTCCHGLACQNSHMFADRHMQFVRQVGCHASHQMFQGALPMWLSMHVSFHWFIFHCVFPSSHLKPHYVIGIGSPLVVCLLPLS